MKRLFDVYKLKQNPDLENQVIAKRVGYKTGGTYKMKVKIKLRALDKFN